MPATPCSMPPWCWVSGWWAPPDAPWTLEPLAVSTPTLLYRRFLTSACNVIAPQRPPHGWYWHGNSSIFSKSTCPRLPQRWSRSSARRPCCWRLNPGSAWRAWWRWGCVSWLYQALRGATYAVMTYLWTFVSCLDEAPSVVDQLARLKDIGKRVDPGLDEAAT